MTPHRPVTRTFQPRRRRLSPTRERVLREHGPRWLVDVAGPPLGRADLTELFGREAPVVLEVGIGLGEALLAMASADPGTDVIGVDVHTPGIAAVVAAVAAGGPTNVRLVHGDVLEWLDRLAPALLAEVRVFFPDPWPKPAHRHKRLVSATNLDRLVAILEPGGRLHVATDIADYAAQVEALCTAHREVDGGPVDRPAARPVTRYERKGLAAGRLVTDLVYVKR